ncbi:MAG: MerR family DNA-binding protein [Pseudonocardiaceae bacterium]|nr:MerR family DNA-binding protein [Pseudonocardiaceae bacterium]
MAVAIVDQVPGYRVKPGVHDGQVRTGELAQQAGVNVQTLRYYERLGLLAEPARSPAGYRAYPADAVRTVRFIKRAQRLGFVLAEIEELLHLADGGPDGCAAVRSMAGDRIADLERRISELMSMRDALARLMATCDLPRTERQCPILREIEPPGSRIAGAQGG